MTKKIEILSLHPLKPEQQKKILDISPDISLQVADIKESEPFWPEIDIAFAWGQMNLDPFLSEAPKLKWIQTLSAGVDHILTPKVVERNIPVTNTKGIHGIPISEYVFATLLSFQRNLPKIQEQQKSKIWKKVTGDEIFGKTIGIIGLGAIGNEIARRAKAFGMTVLGSKHSKTTEPLVDQLFGPDELDQLLPQCDVVVLALPSTKATQGLFDLEKFKLMKPTSIFINISRGDIVIERDLIQALQENIITHAILDVFQTEPLPDTSTLWNLPNLTLTPHISASTPYYVDRAIDIFIDNLKSYMENKPLKNIIDPQKGY